MKYRLFIII